MNTIISSNLKRTSERIDPGGNIINAKTKQIINPVEPEYVPPVATPEALQAPTPIVNTPSNPISKMDEMINKLVEKKIEEIVAQKVAKKVEEALSKL